MGGLPAAKSECRHLGALGRDPDVFARVRLSTEDGPHDLCLECKWTMERIIAYPRPDWVIDPDSPPHWLQLGAGPLGPEAGQAALLALGYTPAEVSEFYAAIEELPAPAGPGYVMLPPSERFEVA